jgi:hypothetical protein
MLGRAPASKDLSLVALIPKWSGNERAVPLHVFMDAIEGSARIGNWSEVDSIQVCVLKLTDTVRAYYNATPELQNPEITWADFNLKFQNRFRDVRTDQYHFAQLQIARQRRNETAAEFLDRCRLLARRTVLCVTDPMLRKFHNEHAERMLLASFVAGLTGTPGRQVRFAIPGILEKALKIATTVAQAEIPERSNETFYSDAALPDITPEGIIRAPAHGSTGRESARHHTASSRTPNRHQQSVSTQVATREAGPAFLLGVMSVAEWVTSLETAQIGD